MDVENIIKELNFKAIRSSGAGGQHVNKTSSKIELTFDLENSNSLSDDEKTLLKTKLSSKLTNENVLILFCEETRSQHRNKDLAIKRFLGLIKTNLIRPKKRKKTGRKDLMKLAKVATKPQENLIGKPILWEYTPQNELDLNWDPDARRQSKYNVKGEIVSKEIVEGKEMYEIEFTRDDWLNQHVSKKDAKALYTRFKDFQKKKARSQKKNTK